MSLGDLFDRIGDFLGPMFDWCFDFDAFWLWSIVKGAIGCVVICALLAVVISPFVGVYVWYDSAHPCTAYGQPYYHAPVYVSSGGGKYGGGTMIPVGGGVYADCTARK